MDESAAIAALRRRDIAGLEHLVRLYQVQAIRVALPITCDVASAEDVVADAFMTVYDRIDQFDVSRPFRPWFYRIVVNLALKGLKRRRRDQVAGGDLATVSDRSPSPEAAAVSRETQADVIDAIRDLPPKQRVVIVLRYYLDMDEATIASTIGRPRGTVKWRLHAARQRLRRSLGRALEESRSFPYQGDL